MTKLQYSPWLKSVEVLDVLGQRDPGMHPLLIDGSRGRRKGWVSKGADGKGDVFGIARNRIKHRGAANRTKMKVSLATRVADTDVLAGLPRKS